LEKNKAIMELSIFLEVGALLRLKKFEEKRRG